MELFPRYRIKRSYAVIITCTVSFLISLPFTCPVCIHLDLILYEIYLLGWNLFIRIA
jgi:hypothetical protein